VHNTYQGSACHWWDDGEDFPIATLDTIIIRVGCDVISLRVTPPDWVTSPGRELPNPFILLLYQFIYFLKILTLSLAYS
jgi:hypothetical protein